jgi:O-antigen/teichoic acid export membrane protein
MGSNWIETVLNGVYVVAISHFLGAELYGAWAYAAAAYGFVLGLTWFGMDMLLPMRLGADRRDSAGFVGVTLALRLALLGIAAVGLAVYALVYEPPGTTRLALLLVIPALYGRGLALWARVVFIGYERAGSYMKMAAGVRVTEVVCGIALLAAGWGLIAVLVLHSLFWLVEAAIGLGMARSWLTRYRPRLDIGETIDLVRKGAVIGLAASLTGWLMAGPVLMLRHVDGDLARLGQFSIALQLAMIMVASVQPFFAAALPVLSRSVTRGDPRLVFYGGLTVLAALLGCGALAGLGFLVGPPLVLWLFGPDFALAGDLVGPCLLLGGLILAPTGYGQLLVLGGRRWPGAIASGIGGLVLLVTLPPAVNSWGVYGAVVAAGGAWLARAIILIASAAQQQTAVGSRQAE